MSSLGSLVVSLAMDTAKFEGDIGKSRQQLARLSAEAAKMGAAVGAAIGAAAIATAYMVKRSIDAADAAGKEAQMVGMAVEEYTALAYAAKLGGVEQEAFASSMVRLAKSATEAAKGTGEAADTYRAMGISVKGANGEIKPQAQLLSEVAEKFASYKDGAEKTALATAIFGKAGAAMIPVLNAGAKGLAEMSDEARVFGLVIATESYKAAEQFNDNLSRMNGIREGLSNGIMKELLPNLVALTDQLIDSAKNSGALGDAARVGAAGVRILIGAAITGVAAFKIFGHAIGAVLAALMAQKEGRFADAWNILKEGYADAAATARGTAKMLETVFDETAKRVEGRSDKQGGQLAAPVVNAAKKAGNAVAKIRQVKVEVDKLAEEWSRKTVSLQFDVDTQGASERIKAVIEATRAVQAGLNPKLAEQYIELVRQQEAYKESTERTAEATRQRNETLAEGARVFEDTRTPAEKLGVEIDRLNKLLQAGAINWDTYARAQFAAQDAYDQAVKKTADEADDFGKRMAQNIQDYLGTQLQEIAQGSFKNIGRGFTNMLTRMVTEAAAAQLSRRLFGDSKQLTGGGGWVDDLIGMAKGAFGGGSSGGGGGNFLSQIGSAIGTFFGGKASFGPVSPGRSYMVGEHGPERFVPAVSGSVQPVAANQHTYVVNVQATPGMSRATAMQQGRQIGAGIQLAMSRNG